MELMSAVLERGNMMRAYERVLRNKGAPGVDGMTVGELKLYLKAGWPEISEQLREGRYHPLPVVRKVEISSRSWMAGYAASCSIKHASHTAKCFQF